eukprot:CAMPEP_0184663662 /NCGR_PEP_ID=MMETSP0308-20130426/49131_1 /TAXON_ID=38269 /ORGANISM="Gloeochaete witrockiana, Strain SAG 46.84" /LENGTH=58 /DNA_ID=CAMNT_0027106539 /DNA_START=129 /DNA_END=305 /DNA_ORIENTATION=+
MGTTLVARKDLICSASSSSSGTTSADGKDSEGRDGDGSHWTQAGAGDEAAGVGDGGSM